MKEFEELFLLKFPRGKAVLRIWKRSTGCEPIWENITKDNLLAFALYMKAHLSPNSCRTYSAYVKAVLTMYEDEVPTIPKEFSKLMSFKQAQTLHIWLNDSDITKILTYKPADLKERHIRNQFIVGCLTGARHSDYVNFTQANIVNNKLVYVSKKTKIRSEVPLSPAVERLINEGLGTIYSDTTFNDTIKVICKNCGIDEYVHVYRGGQEQEGYKWQFVTSHTARRSFATNVYLRCRDIFLVSNYMGHSSVDMTSRYILSIGDAPGEVKDYFTTFK